ncbi:MAG: ornithine carbamoyltransferase [Candidatus Micrarchaeota archaeon]|nr:ornithine carbamoyltransferase [Candidatus Micrarchaeota archaeon]
MNFLSVNDLSRDQMNEIFDIADEISLGKTLTSLKAGSVLALLFEKPSTRTRISFEVAMGRLGGRSIYVDSNTSQMSRGETVSDTARMLSLYVDFVAARLDHHGDLVEFANSSTVPVINAMTDLEHPTQSISDLYTISNAKRKLKGIRIAFVGDIAQNTCNSLMLAAVKLGAEMALVGPKDYPPNPEYLTRSREYGVVDIFDTMADGLAGADIVYIDSFTSLTDTFGKVDQSEVEKRNRLFAKYQVNAAALKYADKDALVMHPLPAFRGREITADVLEGSKSIVWEQAKNKLLLEQAILMFLSEKST